MSVPAEKLISLVLELLGEVFVAGARQVLQRPRLEELQVALLDRLAQIGVAGFEIGAGRAQAWSAAAR